MGNSEDDGENPPQAEIVQTGRRTLMKAAGAGAGAFAVGGTVLGSATAATTSADGNCVQVDLVLGNTINDLGSTTYSSEGRLVAAKWGDYVNEDDTGEQTTKYPISNNCEVDVTSDISIDFSANSASVTFDINDCSSGSQDVTLVSYETPCNSGAGQWDPTNADKETQFFWNTQTFSSNSTGNTMSVEVPDKELIAYYPLDDAVDSVNNGRTSIDVANGNDGTVIGSVDTGATGQVNGAYDIKTGTDSSLDLPPFTPGGDDSITVAGWVYLSSLAGQNQFAFWGDGPPQFELVHLDGNLQFFYYEGGFSGIRDGPTLSTDQWYHLAGTYDDSTGDWTLYVDGSQVASTNDPLGSTNTADVGFSGNSSRLADHPSNGRHLTARLDEFVFYDRALSESEVGDLTNDTVASSGLIAHYELNTDTPVDSSGNGNDATILGSPDTSATGQFDGAYRFQSEAGRLELPAFTPSGDDSISISLWVNADDLSNRREFVFWGDGPPQFELFYSSSLEFIYYDGSEFGITSGPTLTAGQWYHLVGTYDDSTGDWTLYVDGSQAANTTGDTIGSTSTKDLGGFNGDNTFVGLHPNNGFQFEGLVDDVRFYDRALSSGEVTDLYNKGS